jgi:hypothetical protein
VQAERLDVALVYRVRAMARQDTLRVSVDLQGGA